MNGRHVIALTATGRRIPLGAYVAGVRVAIARPESMFKHGLETWFSVSGAHIRQEFNRALADRINAKAPGYGQGRKWRPEWQAATRRLAHMLQARAVTRTRDCPAELRGRLAARLYEESGI